MDIFAYTATLNINVLRLIKELSGKVQKYYIRMKKARCVAAYVLKTSIKLCVRMGKKNIFKVFSWSFIDIRELEYQGSENMRYAFMCYFPYIGTAIFWSIIYYLAVLESQPNLPVNPMIWYLIPFLFIYFNLLFPYYWPPYFSSNIFFYCFFGISWFARQLQTTRRNLVRLNILF